MNSTPESILTVLKSNDGLAVALALIAGPALVLSLIGFIMRRAGASLRPLWFIAALIAPIAVLFLIAGLVRARVPSAASAPPAGLDIVDGRFADRAKLFGPDVPAAMIRDAKSGLPGILDEAEAAEAAATMTGETMLIAQFPTEDGAKRAAASYHRAFQLREVSGDEINGWKAKRGLQDDFIEMLRADRLLFVWTGLSRESCAARRAAANVAAQFPAVLATARPPLLPSLQGLGDFAQRPLVKWPGLVCMVALYACMFFKGAAWAGGTPPLKGAPPLSSRELAARLLAINDLDVPFHIEPGATAGEFVADWRYADAKWLDHARAHGLRRTFRIRLVLDEAAHVVRATDYVASFDWSAGRGGAGIEWQAAKGIIFFQSEQQRVFGLQIDEHGRFKPELSYSYRFDLGEMKSPLIDAVTKTGWSWRPVVWQGPKALRWLTE